MRTIPITQSELYTNMMAYTLKPVTKPLQSADYYLIAEIEGVKFYTPNDEDWGAIIAISHEHKLAHYTSFYEMDDMSNIGGGYEMIVHDGQMKCKFEVGSSHE